MHLFRLPPAKQLLVKENHEHPSSLPDHLGIYHTTIACSFHSVSRADMLWIGNGQDWSENQAKTGQISLVPFLGICFHGKYFNFFSFTACCDLKLTSDYKLNCKYGSCSVKCRSGCQHVTDSADSGSCIAIKWANMLRSHICFIMDAMPNQPFILH